MPEITYFSGFNPHRVTLPVFLQSACRCPSDESHKGPRSPGQVVAGSHQSPLTWLSVGGPTPVWVFRFWEKLWWASLPLPGKRRADHPAHDPFICPARIKVSRVEEVDAEFKGALDL